MKKALILTDYTNDFVADDGKLTAGKPAQDIDSNLAEMIREMVNAGDYVFVMNDLHYEGDVGHPESTLFPPHNLAGSSGRDIYGKTGEVLKELDDYRDKQIFYMDKFRYSCFAGTSLDILLKQFSIKTVVIVGVCSDICVLHTAIDAYNLGYRGIVPKNSVATFNTEGHQFALAHMKNTLGFDVV